jgi:HK97 family phage major capsid protein
MTIAELQAQRAQVQQRVAALAALEAAGTALTAEQLAAFAADEAEFGRLSAQIDRSLAAERMAAAAAVPVDTPAGRASVPATPRTPVAAGTSFAVMVMSIAAGGRDNQAAAQYAETMGYPDVAAALNKSTPSAGGYIVDPGYVAEVVELARPSSVMRASGVRSVPMPSGQMNMGRQNSSASASYIGESVDIPKSEPTLGNLVLTAKKIVSLVPVSNDLVRYANPSAIQLITDDMRAVMGLREDLAFIRDDGTGDQVKGLRYTTDTGNVFAANATINLVNITADTGKAKALIKRANVPQINMGWLFHPDVEQYLTDLRDGNGNLAFPELGRGLFRGLPYKTTTQIPVNLGAGSNETEIYLVEFSQCLIGDSLTMVLDVSNEASYKDGSTLVSAFSRDETVVRAVAAHDFGMRMTKAAAIITGVKWRY